MRFAKVQGVVHKNLDRLLAGRWPRNALLCLQEYYFTSDTMFKGGTCEYEYKKLAMCILKLLQIAFTPHVCL